MRPDFRSLLFILLIAAMPAFAAVPADPQERTVPAAAMTSPEMQQFIDTLKDPARRAALIAALESLQKNAAPAAATPPAAAKPAASPIASLKPNSLGAQLIARGEQMADMVSASLLLAVRGVTDIPDLLRWLHELAEDPATMRDGAIAAGRLLCVLLIALAGEFLIWRLTHRFYESLATDARREDRKTQEDEPGPQPMQNDPWPLLRRLPYILMAATVDLLPPLAFLAVATLLLGTPLAQSSEVRTGILAVVDAYVVVRIIGSVARAAFGAPSARLRLLPVSDELAAYLMVWVRRIAVVIVFGYAVSQLALLFGMDSDSEQGVLRLVSLLVHIMLAWMVLQCRARVAVWLRGSEQGRFSAPRRMLAGVWHIYAIVFIAGGWIVYAAEIRDGFAQLVHFMLSAIIVGLAARVADIVLVGALDHGFTISQSGSGRFARVEERVARYHNPLRIILRLAIGVAAVVTLLQVWGIDALGWFDRGAFGNRLAASAATLTLTLGVAIALWEVINVAMQAYLDELSQQGAAVRAARLRTVVPLLRNALLITLMILITLTALSELGVNIGPLLAGASIFGVAIGFGSQKLVQDFITGIFLLVENAMQVGDSVTAGGLSGTVENLSIRTLRLRAGDGSVHLIPFSSVSTVTNSNRGLGNVPVAVTVEYEEDTDRVGAVLTKIVAEMRAEEAFSSGMMSDLQLWGVDRVDGTTATLAGQIVCTDAARWGVQREFNRRIKLAFHEEGIRMTPAVSVTAFRHPLDVRVEQPPVAKQTADVAKAKSAKATVDVGP
jgi:moderate conductance mechanosensitive channel